MRSRAGIGMAALLAVLAVVVVAGAGAAYYLTGSGCGFSWSTMRCIELSDIRGVPCTSEARICPDGSAVGRTGPSCLFAACPELAEISSEACRAQGGEVVNTLAGTPSYQPSEVLGEIREANCPCVCVRRVAADDQPYQGVIAEFLSQWPEIQKQVPFKPVLGSTSWHVTAFEFLSPTSFIVAFEDGHVAAAVVVGVGKKLVSNLPPTGFSGPSPNPVVKTLFSIMEVISPDRFPMTADAWYALLGRHGGSSALAKTFVTSVVRGTEVITFNGWVEVPENLFVRTVPSKGL